jgi:hypothetical protein
MLISKKIYFPAESGWNKSEPLIISSANNLVYGYIKQVVVRDINGLASNISLRISYSPDNSEYLEDLIYEYIDSNLPLVDTCIDAPYSILERKPLNNILYIYTNTDVATEIVVRVDLEIYFHKGN